MKKLAMAAGVLGLLGVAAAYVVFTNAGKIVKSAVESFGPQVLGAPVSVRSVRLSPLSGKGSVSGLVIGNPAGFETKNAFELGEVRLAVDYKSLLSDKIHINEIVVKAPKVTYETGPKGSNIAVLMKNVEAFTGPSSSASSSSPAPKLQIDRFDFSDGSAAVHSKLLGGKTVNVNLPPLQLEGLGKGPEGITPADAAKVIFRSISGSIVKAVATVPGLDAAVEGAKKAVGEAKEHATKALGGLKGLFKKK